MKKTKIFTNSIITLVIIFFASTNPLLAQAVTTTDVNNNIITSLNVTEIININNNTRKQINLKPLVVSEELTKLAKLKMDDMKNNQYFDHYSPTKKSLKNFLDDINYDYIYAGENLARNFDNNKELVQAWLDSPTHRYNMLYPNFDEVGIYYDYVNLDGTDQLVTVMIFGKKKSI